MCSERTQLPQRRGRNAVTHHGDGTHHALTGCHVSVAALHLEHYGACVPNNDTPSPHHRGSLDASQGGSDAEPQEHTGGRVLLGPCQDMALTALHGQMRCGHTTEVPLTQSLCSHSNLFVFLVANTVCGRHFPSMTLSCS